MENNNNSNYEENINAVQAVQINSLDTITRAEIDMQITTAKTYPRTLSTFKQRAISMATLDRETAEGCFYKIPRSGKTISGPSVRLAEIVLSAWGNIRAAARVIANDKKTITAQAICHDLETNTAITIEVQRRITGKDGRTYTEDLQVVTGNAACAIALRNAIFKIIPMAYTKCIYDNACLVAAGDGKDLNARRIEALERFKTKYGISNERVFNSLNLAGIEDIGTENLLTLIGLWNALRDGDTSPEEAFPLINPKAESTVIAETALLKTLNTIKEKKNGNHSEILPGAKSSKEAVAIIVEKIQFYKNTLSEAKQKNNKKIETEMQKKIDSALLEYAGLTGVEYSPESESANG